MPLPRISETEWEIMRIVWKRHPVTSADVIAQLQKEDASWRAVTAKTLLNRLVRKGALCYEAIGRVYHYSATCLRPSVLPRPPVLFSNASLVDPSPV